MRRQLLLWSLATALVIGSGAAATFAWWWTKEPMLDVQHAPAVVTRRSGELSANLCGTAFRRASLRYRVNEGDWTDLAQTDPRSPAPWWTIELLPKVLREGINDVEIHASAVGRTAATERLTFEYDPAPLSLPTLVDWRQPLEVQDGHWEVVEVDGERRVRPVPGSERYDRILLATGAFAGGRRVETDMVFRGFRPWQTWAGFGVLTLWGGHLDQPGRFPRNGWLYAVAWYMKPYGPWCEFSVKQGDGARVDAFTGNGIADPHPDSRWSLIAECWPETDGRGEHVGYRQRMKLWPSGEPEPAEWLECSDRGGARLPAGEYAVAVVAHECQVEFGPLRVLPLATAPARPNR
ncbi:MAG: hypothetical protein AAF628_10065 [Planctomycetota bacterium]